MTASIRRTPDGTFCVRFPYHPGVVGAIKRLVPAGSRRYDPSERAWYVASAYQRIIRDLLTDVFIEVETDPERAAYTPPTGTTPATSYSVLHLLPTAPPELVESAYRTLSRLHHPDAGGDTAEMQELNHAVARIRRIRA